MRRARTPAVLAAAVLAGAALSTVGCGGSSGSSVVAHLSLGKSASSPSSGGIGPAPEGTASPAKLAVAYAKCMRTNGVPDFPDPSANGGFVVGRGIDRSVTLLQGRADEVPKAHAGWRHRSWGPHPPRRRWRATSGSRVHATTRHLRLPRPPDLGTVHLPGRHPHDQQHRRGDLRVPGRHRPDLAGVRAGGRACGFPLHNH